MTGVLIPFTSTFPFRVLYWNMRNHLIWRVLPQFYTVHAVSLGEFGSCSYRKKKKTEITLTLHSIKTLESWAARHSFVCLFSAAVCHVRIGPTMFSVDVRFRQTTRKTIWIRVCLPALHQRGKCRTWVWVYARRRVHESKHHTKARLIT